MIHGTNFSQLLKLELYENFNLEDEITGPYKPVSSHPIIPSSMRTGLYASHFLPMSDNLDEFFCMVGIFVFRLWRFLLSFA